MVGFDASLVIAAVVLGNPGWPADDPELDAAALAMPANQPDDPWFTPTMDPMLGCVGQHELFSFTPECAARVTEVERTLGTGIHADRAWLLTIGRSEISIAFIDTGVDWSDADLVARWRLNPHEVPVPAGSTVHDANGDGAFTVLDFTTATGTQAPTRERIADPRLRDIDGNGLLDPRDLLQVFSDGVDDDQNGFVDDLCGWDFADGDNDAGSSDRHGTAMASAAIATANNGVDGAGVCPNCLGIPLRAGSGARADANAIAAAIEYAAANRAGVALVGVTPIDAGTIDAGVSAAAMDAADGQRMLVVAHAGNSSGPHQVSPWDAGRALLVGAIGLDEATVGEAASVFAADPCSSFGAQLGVVAPGHCDERSAALAAGVAGLVLSVGAGVVSRNIAPLDPPLSALELRHVLTSATDRRPDVALDATWTARQGHGRINARDAVETVTRRLIPPAPRILAPDWYATIHPESGRAFGVTARVHNPRYAEASWVLEYGVGLAPPPGAFSPVASGSVERGASINIDAQVPLFGLFDDPSAPPDRPTSAAVTLRLTVSAPTSGTAEARRLVFVHRDIYTLPGYPLSIDGAPAGGPRALDIDDDGSDEALVTTAEGRLLVFEATGAAMADWRAPTLGPMVAAVSVGRLTPDAPLIIAAGTLAGEVMLLDDRGVLLDGFPVHAATSTIGSNAITMPVVLADVDGDDALDALVTTAGGVVDAFSRAGARLDGFPIRTTEALGAAAVGVLDDEPIIAVASQHRLYVFGGDGQPTAGWPATLTAPPFDPALGSRTVGVELGEPPGPIIGDFDGDETAEIAVAAIGRAIAIFAPDGSLLRELDFHDRAGFSPLGDAARQGPPVFVANGQTAAGDLDRDGVPDLIHSAATRAFITEPARGAFEQVETLIAAWSPGRGGFAPGFPNRATDRFRDGFLIADLDQDGRDEVVFGDRAYRLHAISAAGVSPKGWPKLLGGAIGGTPTVADLDGDGHLEVLATTSNGLLFAWRTDADADAAVPWEAVRHDYRATGDLRTPTIRRIVSGDDRGCGCATGRAQSDAPWLALLLLAALVSWRSRSLLR